METNIRLAKSSDIERVADILIESRKAFMPYAPSAHTEQEMREWVREYLLPSGGVTVAVRERYVVAVLAVSKSEGVNWIDQMYIDPQYVNEGIGTIMLSKLFETMQQPIRLHAFQENEGARRLYERLGFRALQFTNGEDNEENCPDVLYELAAET